MNIKKLLFFLILSFVVLLLLSSCYKGGKMPKEYKRLMWEPGQWAEYITVYPDRAYIVRYSILDRKEDSLYKVESMYIEDEDTTIVQVTTDYGFKNIYNMIIKKKNSKPYMFEDYGGKIKLTTSLDSFFRMGERVDSFKVFTKVSSMGDTLPCFKMLSDGSEECYFSNDVPVTGLVYYKDGIKEIKLIQYGVEGAESHIKDTPIRVSVWQIYSRRIRQLFEGEIR